MPNTNAILSNSYTYYRLNFLILWLHMNLFHTGYNRYQQVVECGVGNSHMRLLQKKTIILQTNRNKTIIFSKSQNSSIFNLKAKKEKFLYYFKETIFFLLLFFGIYSFL